ncbi:MAG: ester cyclase [Streptosporangiaceae bacterium]|nr:ester cyclase [Streptosporangiaceae bacterium]
MNSVSELNKLKIRLFVEAVVNEGRLELISDLVAADYRGFVSGGEAEVIGPEGLRRLVTGRRRAHPGLYVKIEDQIAEDDRVVTRWLATATTPGSRTAGARGRPIPCCVGISITRLLAGKQVDSHTECTKLIFEPTDREEAPAMP